MRQAIVALVADLLKVDVEFPIPKDAWVEPKNRQVRLVKETMYTGEVFWYVEEYFTSRRECEMFVPSRTHELYDRFKGRTNGKLDDRVYFWARHPKKCHSMDEAIEYLNNKIKKNVPLDTSYVDIESST